MLSQSSNYRRTKTMSVKSQRQSPLQLRFAMASLSTTKTKCNKPYSSTPTHWQWYLLCLHLLSIKTHRVNKMNHQFDSEILYEIVRSSQKQKRCVTMLVKSYLFLFLLLPLLLAPRAFLSASTKFTCWIFTIPTNLLPLWSFTVWAS